MAVNKKNEDDVTYNQNDDIAKFINTIEFFFSSLDEGPSFTATELLFLELCQFSSIKDLNRNPETDETLHQSRPTFGDWKELEIPNLT